MKRIVLSVLIAIGVHGFLLSADFKLPWSSVKLPAIPDRLTVVMVPAPMPALKSLPSLLPPPTPELMAQTDVAVIPFELPKEIPITKKALPILQPNPKNSLKARTYKPRVQPPVPEPKQQPVVQPKNQTSTQKAATNPQLAAPVENAPKKLTSVAAVHKPKKILPDRPAIPLLKKNPPPAYPKSARRRGYQGSVVLKVLIGANGMVEAVEIDQSCGYLILDQAALSAVRDWQFKPGIKDGQKVKMWVKVPVRFHLK